MAKRPAGVSTQTTARASAPVGAFSPFMMIGNEPTGSRY
jgi:hypothetical protein